MPRFLENKLKREYPNNPRAVYGTMNAIGAMRGSRVTPQGMDSSEQDLRTGHRLIGRDGEEYTPEAIEQRSHPIPAHRVVGKLEAALAIHDAVAAERERCAKIAEDMMNTPGRMKPAVGCAELIAMKIRSGE